MRGISSVGRAPALQAGCQEFESPILHCRSDIMKLKVTKRQLVDKNGNRWEWEETEETLKAIQQLQKSSKVVEMLSN
jgi:hypothetical protein